jgi:hypothetical protein
MKPEYTKLRQEQAAAQAQGLGELAAQTNGRDFASVEELLRHDSENNPVPPEIGERLNASLEAEVPREKPWYKRIFGG